MSCLKNIQEVLRASLAQKETKQKELKLDDLIFFPMFHIVAAKILRPYLEWKSHLIHIIGSSPPLLVGYFFKNDPTQNTHESPPKISPKGCMKLAFFQQDLLSLLKTLKNT